MADDSEGVRSFKEGTWYKCRVMGGACLRESSRRLTPYVSLTVEVITGPMWGDKLVGEIWLSEKTKDRAADTLKLMGFDVINDDWERIGEKIEGAELEVEPQMHEWKGVKTPKARNYRATRPDDAPPLSVAIASLFGNVNTFPTEADKATGENESDHDDDGEPKY